MDNNQIIKNSLNDIYKLLGNEVKQLYGNKILEYQVEEFKKNKYSKTILFRAEPRDLFDYYVPLFLSRVGESRRIPTDSPKFVFGNSRNDISNCVTIIGNAGSGKSTLLKYFLIKSILEEFKIPIKIELRHLNKYDGSLIDYIYKEKFKYFRLGISDEIIERMLNKDIFLFLLDGFDEVLESKKEKVANDITRFTQKFPKNFYALTTRPYTIAENLPLFTNYHVSDLNYTEINRFVVKQHGEKLEEKRLAEKIVATIFSPENEPFKDLVKNPLLLSMYILTYQTYSNLPQNKSEFYRQVFDALFYLHGSLSKFGYQIELRSGLSKESFDEILKMFSFISYFKEKYNFTERFAKEVLNEITLRKSLEYRNGDVINDLTKSISIWVRDGLELTYLHKSIQEYFSSLYISQVREDSDKKQIYDFLLGEIKISYRFITGREHFFSLLKEVDSIYILKYIAVPLLNELLRECSDLSNLDSRGKERIFARLVIVLNLLIPDFLSKYYKKFIIPFNHYCALIELAENDSRILTSSKILSNSNISRLLKYFHKKGNSIIDDLEKEVAHRIKSDRNIIRLL